MKVNKRILVNSGAGIGYSVASAFLMLYLYREVLTVLGPSELGIWSLVLASTSLARLSELGLSAGTEKFVATHLSSRGVEKASKMVETSTLATALITGVAAIVGVVAVPFILPFFLPVTAVPVAVSLLPIVFASFWLGSTAGCVLAGLAGCRRYDRRSTVQLVTLVLYVAAGVWWVRLGGLTGLAFAQLLQACSANVLAWLMLRRHLTELSFFPLRWDSKTFREVLGYGSGFQLASVFQMLGDPVTKALMSRFGGLEATGYFELANQLVTRVHGLVSAAFHVLTAEVADLVESSASGVRKMFQSATEVSGLATIVAYGAAIGILPLVSWVLTGELNGRFVGFGVILVMGYSLLSYGSACYFFLLGLGRVRVIVLTRLVIAVPNLLLGVILGAAFGGFGVAIGWGVGLISGAVFLLRAARPLVGKVGLNREAARLAVLILIGLLVGYLPIVVGETGLSSLVGPFVCLLVALSFALWLKRELLRRMADAAVESLSSKGLAR